MDASLTDGGQEATGSPIPTTASCMLWSVPCRRLMKVPSEWSRSTFA